MSAYKHFLADRGVCVPARRYDRRGRRSREISHVPQQQVVGGVLAARDFRRGRRPEILVPVATGYQQQFARRAHLPLVQRLPSQLGETLRQMADQRQESHVARVTVRYAWKNDKTTRHEVGVDCRPTTVRFLRDRSGVVKTYTGR